jgi:hypothetical protein
MQAIPSTPELPELLRQAAEPVLAAYQARKPRASDQVTPAQLSEALEQLFAIMTKLDREEGETGPILGDDVTQLGEYGLSLLGDLGAWATQLELKAARQEVEKLALPVTDWVIRHEGKIRTLEPVVNALALTANTLKEPVALGKLAGFMGRIVAAVDDVIKQDLEKSNPGRPWRVLQLNRGIVATRSHNPTLMEPAFDDLVKHLPEDAAVFFAEGMRQMEALDYPAPVREVMGRYHQAYAQRALH